MTDISENCDQAEAIAYTDSGHRVDMAKIRKNLPGLSDLFIVAHSAAETFREEVKAVAEASGLRPAVLARYVRVVCAGKLAEQRRDAEQLQLLFDEVTE